MDEDDDVPPLVVPGNNAYVPWAPPAPGHPITDYRLVWPLVRAVGMDGVYDDEDACEFEHRLALLGLDPARLVDACQRHVRLRPSDRFPQSWDAVNALW